MIAQRLSSSWVFVVLAVLAFPLLGADGGCGGEVITASTDAAVRPTDAVVPPGDAGVCNEAACGHNPFGAPNFVCPDGSVGGPVCGTRTDGTCGWYIRACPSGVDAGTGCAIPGGGVCALGATCPSADGCNTCTCTARGLACTERACAVDASAGCALPDGRVCAVGMSCPAGDGCNTCSCGADGRLACTLRACPVDAGSGCVLPSGGTCAAGATCPAGDGCNDCTCDSSGHARCTARPCAADAGVVDVMCVPECPAPPPGCHYEGPVSCSPPSCGRLVCASDAGAPITCGAGGGGSFPSFDRSCRAASDCYVAMHQTDCCGDSHAMGISASQRDAFEAAEAICRPMYPRCGCPTRPPVTDNGTMATFSSTIAVDCRAGTCTTYVRP